MQVLSVTKKQFLHEKNGEVMNYNEASAYLLSIPKFSKKTTKHNLMELLKRLGNPQEKVKSVHVAGTNGKGSVCAFLNTILLHSKKSVGLFTSPHLVRINERIKINNTDISDEEFTKIFEKVKSAVDILQQQGGVHPSFFEFLFVMAALFFAEHKTEYAIFEVGLGGRLDATNVLKNPVVSVIASISYDHTEILGNSIAEIAGEKAGIIKKNVPVVFYQNSPEAAEVIKKTARQTGTEYFLLSDRDIKFIKFSSKQVDFSLDNRYYKCDSVKINFPALYQAVNCSLTLLAFEMIRRKDKTLQSIVHPEEFVLFTEWQGRMEQVKENIFLDGAHNLEGIAGFLASVQKIQTDGRRLLLFGVVEEKNYEHMIELLMSVGVWQEVFITRLNNKRTVSETELTEIFRRCSDIPIHTFDCAGKALKHALAVKQKDDILFCAGSLYLIGELKEYLEV